MPPVIRVVIRRAPFHELRGYVGADQPAEQLDQLSQQRFESRSHDLGAMRLDDFGYAFEVGFRPASEADCTEGVVLGARLVEDSVEQGVAPFPSEPVR